MNRLFFGYDDLLGAQKFMDDSAFLMGLAMVLVVIIVINTLQDLRKILPSFGVLFDTVNQAKFDLFFFTQVI